MNKTAIKNFAVWARVQLIEAAKQRAYEYEVTENGENKPNVESIGDRLLSKDEQEQRNQLIAEINRKGYTQVMEEAAYTWFNRFIALRFMEVNGYLPSKVRVFTDENNNFKPEILKEAMTVEIDGLDRNKVFNYIDIQNNEELYKYLIITQCNALNAGLPLMFEKISNWTELLFPKGQLKQDSVLAQMISAIPEEDWTDQVQIIGWLYQYYNSELKDETFALLKKNVKISKERIPAATQLFTPDWIVRYMVENSLGRIYIKSQCSADSEEERIEKEKALAEKLGWKYYLPEAEQTPEVRSQLATNHYSLATELPSMKVIDPCMGSGHILVYAFDVLMQIYTDAGWSEREAAKAIVENNLYGIDIDDRATQLAYFAVMMKARHYSRRILNGETKPNLISVTDSNQMTDEFISFAAGNDNELKGDLITLRETFTDAKDYGSIISVPKLNFDKLYERIDDICNNLAENMFTSRFKAMTAELLLPLVKQAQIMAQKYDVVVTNPPYIGASNMSAKLSEFVKKNFPDSKSDLFACFIEHGNEMVKKYGYNSMVTMQSWMFLSSFEKMRKKVLENTTITNLMHMENMVMNIAFGTAVTIMQNSHIPEYKGTYNHIKLQDIENERPKEFPVKGNRFAQTSTDNFSKIPGSPVAYWVSEKFIHIFESKDKISNHAVVFEGLKTRDKERFLRFWFEVSSSKWVYYAKGGSFRRWYGNGEYVVNWGADGSEVRAFPKSSGANFKYYFKPAITYSALTSYKFSARYIDNQLFGGGGGGITSIDHLEYILAFTNSCVFHFLMNTISSTMNFEVGQIGAQPVLYENKKEADITAFVTSNISLSRTDWDSYETSWDFKRNPMV
jgi:hypothetical protein